MNTAADRGTVFSRLVADAITAPVPGASPTRASPASPAAGTDVAVPLPAPAPPRQSLEWSLRRRVSVRSYREQPVDLDQLAAVLAAADAQDAGNWASERVAGIPLHLVCAAWRVSSLPAGLYRFQPADRTLTRLGALPTGEAAADLVLQREFATAPAMVFVLGDLAAAVRRHGSHGHRLLLTRAGAAAHAAWLAALGRGLDGAVFAGLLPSAVAQLLGSDGYHSASLFAFSVGWPGDHAAARDTGITSPKEAEGGESWTSSTT
jgi:nitroreductase